MSSNPAFDEYIAKAAPFAQPILTKIRAAFHKACPDVEETMKWRTPHFEYKGIIGSMAAFKQHVSWGFWKAKLMKDPKGILEGAGEDTTSIGFAKLTDAAQLPSEKVMIDYIREAVRLNEEGIAIERAPRGPAKPVEVPDYLSAALKKNAAARKTFESFPPSHRREYIEWITEAKQDATRKKRLDTAIEWLSEGKSRNWKYEK